MKILFPAMLVLAITPLAACRTNDRASAPARSATTQQALRANTVDREYAKPADAVWKAALAGADAANFKVTNAANTNGLEPIFPLGSPRAEEARLQVPISDTEPVGADLVATRADGSQVQIQVRSIDRRHSRLWFRVERGDRELANMLHKRVADTLGTGAVSDPVVHTPSAVTAKAEKLGGNSVDGTYRADFDAAAASGYRTLAWLNLTPAKQEHGATSGTINGLGKDSTPVRITLDKVDGLTTRVTFSAGHAKSDENQALAQQMKDEFETMTPLLQSPIAVSAE